jgi:hypothetical protein
MDEKVETVKAMEDIVNIAYEASVVRSDYRVQDAVITAEINETLSYLGL